MDDWRERIIQKSFHSRDGASATRSKRRRLHCSSSASEHVQGTFRLATTLIPTSSPFPVLNPPHATARRAPPTPRVSGSVTWIGCPFFSPFHPPPRKRAKPRATRRAARVFASTTRTRVKMRLLPTGSHPHAESTRASASVLEPISFFFSHRRWVPFFSGGASFEHPPRTRTRARVVRRAARGFPGATRTRVMMLRAPPGSHPHAENTHASAPLLARGFFFERLAPSLI